MNNHNRVVYGIAIVIGIIILVAIARSTASPQTQMPASDDTASTTTQGIPDDTSSVSDASSTTATPMTAGLIHAPGGDIYIEIAETPDQQTLGLGGRDSLPANQGMLFPFSQPGVYSFWMKDMNFPLDMVWIDANKKVAGVTADISPDTYPNTFNPPSQISYVLELNAGAAVKFGITSGTILKF
jgi:uncharacterized membrane protein (UPF0127 family)